MLLLSYERHFVKMNLCLFLASRLASCIRFQLMSHLYLFCLCYMNFHFPSAEERCAVKRELIEKLFNISLTHQQLLLQGNAFL